MTARRDKHPGLPPEARGRRFLRIVANLMIVAGIGCIAYLGATDLVNSWHQSKMRGLLGPLGETEVSRLAGGGPNVLDFSGWDRLDAAYWRKLPTGGPFGRLAIAKIGLDSVVVKGTRTGDLQKGPGWILDSDLPGPDGNAAVSGHRTTFGRPFWALDRLEPGDPIDLYSPFRRYRYQVVRKFVVTPDRVDVIGHTDQPELTMTACHPFYSAQYRLVIQARLIDVRMLSQRSVPQFE